jgi:hypothetical protein
VVESTALEMRRTCKGIGGSNPSLSAIFIVGLLSLASPAPAQNQNPNAPKLDPVTGKLLDAFGGLAAAWYIEKRCDHLGKDLKAEFERNVAQTNVGLSRKVEVKFLLTLQQSGQKVAETKSCGDETRKLVIEAVALSRETARSLTGGQSDSPTAAAGYDAQRVAALLLAQKVDDKCKKMPAHIRTEFDGRIVAITKSFVQSTGEPALGKLRTASSEAFQKIADCDKAEAFLRMTLGEARQMSPSWKAN